MSTVSTTVLNVLAASYLGTGSPATLYARFFIGASTGLTGGTEATGGSYAAVAVTNNTVNFPAPTNGVITLDANIATPRSTAAWGTINCVRFYDAATGGYLRLGAMLSPTVSVDATGITITIEAGSLTFTVASSA